MKMKFTHKQLEKTRFDAQMFFARVSQKVYLVAILFLMLNVKGISQQRVYSDLSKLNITNIVSPLPNSAAIIGSDNVTMNGNTGVPDISFPVYTINTHDITIPIVLSYNASGIKVNQMASWVGLGWSLNAGGVITREIRGQEDELAGKGFCYGGGEKLKVYVMNNAAFTGNSVTYTNVNETIIAGFAEGTYDGEPDVYHYSFGNYSGKFIMDKDRNVHFIPKTNLKIEISRINPPDNNIQSITITDEKGIKYTFDILEKTREKVTSFQTWLCNYCANYGSQRFDAPANENTKTYENFHYQTTGWHLSKIEFPDMETITFNYVIDEPSYISNTNEKYFYRKGGCYTETVTSGFDNDQSVIAKDFTLRIAKQPRITSIEWKEGIISFEPKTELREDLNDYTSNKSPALKQISVKDKFYNKTILTCELNTSYFTNTADPQYLAHPHFFKRLRLDGFTLNDKPYSFLYNDQFTLPARLSHEVDFWGYYKSNPPHDIYSAYSPTDKLNSHIARPYVYVNGSSPFENFRNNDNGIYCLSSNLITEPYCTIPGVDRNSDEANMQIAILKIIKFPTGGTTTLDYQIHDFIYNGRNLTGGGLRIHKITNHDGLVTSPDVIRTFKYNNEEPGQYAPISTSGVCLALPKLCKRDLFAESGMFTLICEGSGIYNSPINTLNYTTTFLDNETNCGVFNGNAVVYSQITELNSNGKTIKKFEIVSDVSNYYQDYYGKVISTTTNDLYGTFANYPWLQDHYPPVPAFNLDWRNCVLNEENMYDNDNHPVKKIKYTYLPHYTDEVFYAIKTNIVALEYYQRYEIPVNFKDFRWCVYGYYTNWYKLVEKTEEDYSSNSNILDKIVSRNIFSYNSDHLISLNTKKYSSDGSTIAINYKYPLDYPSIDCEEAYHCTENRDDCYSQADKTYDLSLVACEHYDSNSPEYADCIEQAENELTNANNLCDMDYMECCNNCNAELSLSLEAIKVLKQKHMIASLVEKNKKVNGEIVEGEVTEYIVNNFNQVHPYKTYSFTSPNPVEIEQLSYSAADLTSIVIDYCDSTITYDKWDAQGNLIENHIVNGIYTNYIWGYNNTHPIAETKNATTTECGYTGFENNESNSFPIPEYADFKYVDDAFSGRVALKVGSEYGPGTSFEVKTNADNHSGYKASVWVKGPEEAYLHIQVNEDWDKSVRVHNPKGSDDWHLLEVELPRVKYESDISSTLNIRVYIGVEGGSGIAYFDDLRFYPMDAQMTTYTYDPLIGVISVSDVNNKPTTYEYDGFGRLVLARDYLGDILKKYEYHYKTP